MSKDDLRRQMDIELVEALKEISAISSKIDILTDNFKSYQAKCEECTKRIDKIELKTSGIAIIVSGISFAVGSFFKKMLNL